MKITKSEYARLLARRAPPSPLLRDTLLAGLVGGLICVYGQGVRNLMDGLGLDEQLAATATSIVLIATSGLLTVLGLYGKLAKYAGAGTLVPITGFANAIVSPAMEFKSEGLVTGMAAKMFVIAGPVLVYGISASVIYGLVLFFLGSAPGA